MIMKGYAQLGFLFCSLIFVTSLNATTIQDEDSGLEDNLSYHLYDDIDLISTLKFEYGRPRIVIKAVFPQLASDTERNEISVFNQLSVDTVKEVIRGFREQVKNNQLTVKTSPADKINNNFYIDYNSAYLRAKKDHIISIRYTLQSYMGGQNHSETSHQSFNYNLSNMREISLADLFLPESNFLNILASYSRDNLHKKLKQTNKIDAGTLPIASNFKIWNLTVDGLLLTFEENQVASRLYGAQTVMVPYAVLSNILSPDSPITDCLRNKMRCFRGHLVTGGFIDEA